MTKYYYFCVNTRIQYVLFYMIPRISLISIWVDQLHNLSVVRFCNDVMTVLHIEIIGIVDLAIFTTFMLWYRHRFPHFSIQIDSAT